MHKVHIHSHYMCHPRLLLILFHGLADYAMRSIIFVYITFIALQQDGTRRREGTNTSYHEHILLRILNIINIDYKLFYEEKTKGIRMIILIISP